MGGSDFPRRPAADLPDGRLAGAPILLVTLRLVQGLALGGEYGGAATYVAEACAATSGRGLRHELDPDHGDASASSSRFWSIGLCRVYMDAKVFADWGWRIPFWLSLFLLVFSVYIRLKLHESPVFQQMKAEGQKAPSSR